MTSAQIRAYMTDCVKIDLKQRVEIGGDSADEAKAAIRAVLILHGWPENDPLYDLIK